MISVKMTAEMPASWPAGRLDDFEMFFCQDHSLCIRVPSNVHEGVMAYSFTNHTTVSLKADTPTWNVDVEMSFKIKELHSSRRGL